MTPMERDLKQIIADYREALTECGSAHAEECVARNAFKEILEMVNAYEQIEKGKVN